MNRLEIAIENRNYFFFFSKLPTIVCFFENTEF
jgi:hypothetical protein